MMAEAASPIFQADFTCVIMSFKISATSAEVKDRKSTAVKLGADSTIGAISAIFGHPTSKPLIEEAVTKTFGRNERDKKEVREIRHGSLHVPLYCFTEAKFLEVLKDYDSGEIKQRLEEEFLKVGIKTTELAVEIENMEEVEERKAALEER